MLEKAQNKGVKRLLKAWTKQIEEDAKLLEQQEKREAQRHAQEAALAASVRRTILGLRRMAHSDRLPTGVRVASLPPSVLVNDNLTDALAGLSEDLADLHDPGSEAREAQANAAWALKNGAVPHPGDIARLLEVNGDHQAARQFQALGDELEAHDQNRFKHPQLQALRALKRLKLVGATVRELEAYGADRTARLITNPRTPLEVPGKLGKAGALEGMERPTMSEGQIYDLASNLFPSAAPAA